MIATVKPKYVVGIWLLLFLGLFLLSLLVGSQQTIPGPASVDTISRNHGEQQAIRAGIPPRDTLFVTLRGPQGFLENAGAGGELQNLANTLAALRVPPEGSPLFRRVQTFGGGSWLLSDEFFRGRDGQHFLLKADLDHAITESSPMLATVPQVLADWQSQHSGFEVHFLSSGTVDNEIVSLIHNDLDRSLIYTVPLTLLVLLWAFGSVVGALVPLIIALVSLLGSLGGAAVLSHVVGPMSATASQLVVLLVLALGVDYSLLTLSRVREETAAGKKFADAVLLAQHCSGRAIFWSGLTVALSILGLFLMDDSVLTSMAVVSLLAVLVTMVSCIVVLPSLILVLGPRIEYGRIFSLKKSGRRSLLQILIERSLRDPWTVCGVSIAGLVAISFASLQLRLGSTFVAEFLPKTMQSISAHTVLKEQFPKLAGTQFSVIFSHQKLRDFDEETTLQPVVEGLLATDLVNGPLAVEWSQNGQVVRYQFSTISELSREGKQLVLQTLREKLVPEFLGSSGIEMTLSGLLPYEIDSAARYAARTPWVIVVVLFISFIFLTVAFQSLVIPLKAVLLNLLSTGASFGVLVLVFQGGMIPGLQYGVIESFVPALLFAILFGLSMDYHVFLLSRIREQVLAGADTTSAVRAGILSTARTITSAALIMAAVFLVMATLELPLLKQLGVGLAVAVLVDATVIRSLLLPASMQLLGKWNWYLPGWLAGKIKGN